MELLPPRIKQATVPHLHKREQPIAIYMEGATQGPSGKMGFGMLRYSPNPIACIIDSGFAGQNARDITGIPRDCPIVASISEAIARGAEVFALGIAPPGGLIPEAWMADIDSAVHAGMCIINGLHDLLGPRYPVLRDGQWVWDIRIEPEGLQPGSGRALTLSNHRVLMIGTDMAIGKMTAGLELYRVARERGIQTEFVATGQIGITVTGRGVPLDAIRVDFAAGAIEREVLAVPDAELVIVEGQGSLGHPASTANLALIRGSVPTHFVMCARAGQEYLRMLPNVRVAPLGALCRLYEDLAEACGTFPRPETVGVALNTSDLATDTQAMEACERLAAELGLPVTDPVRFGPEPLLNAIFPRR